MLANFGLLALTANTVFCDHRQPGGNWLDPAAITAGVLLSCNVVDQIFGICTHTDSELRCY